MYVEQSTGANVIKAITQGVNFAAQNLDYADTLMKEKAKSDMFYAQAQLNADAQNFLRGLEQKNDYENFGKYTEDFMSKQKSALQKQAKNHYTAQLYDQMLTQARDSLYNTVAAKTMQMEYMHIGTQNASTMALNRNNLQGQAGIDANNSVINSEYSNGYRDEAYTKAALLDDGTKNITKDVYTQSKALMDSVFNNGGSFADVEKQLDALLANTNYSIKMLTPEYASPEGMALAQETGKGYIDIGNEIDKKVIKDSVKKNLKSQWDLALEAEDEKNYSACTEGYAKLWELPKEQRINYANGWIRKIETDMGGHHLTAAHRRAAVDMFKAITEGKAATGKGEDFEKAFLKIIEKNQNFYIEEVIKGVNTGYDARGLFETAVLTELNKYQPEASLYDLRKQFPQVMGFLDALQKKAPDQIKGIVKDTESLFKDVSKKLKLDDSGELAGGLTELLWDEINACKYTDDASLKEIATNLNKEINSLSAKELDIVRKNFKTDNHNLKKGAWGNDKTLAQYLNTMEQHPDLVYSDKYGKDRLSIFANGDEVIEIGNTWQKEYLQKELGINPGTLQASFEPEEEASKRDVKAVQIFTSTDGTMYKLRSADGKNITISTSKDGKNWSPVETKTETKDRTDKEDKAVIMEKALAAAENLDQKALREAGITNVEWLKNASNKKWLAGAISDMVGRYNQSKNELERTNLKNKLKALGYSF